MLRTLTLIFLLATAYALSACNSGQKNSVTEDEVLIRFANTGDEVEYVGDASCSSCHAEEYAGYQEHGMAMAFDTVSADNRNEVWGTDALYHSQTDFYYQPVVADSGYFQEEFRLDETGRKVHSILRRMDYVVGSGGAAQTYLTDDNGWLYELPLTWYNQNQRWDFSPGYDVVNVRFSRLIPDRCMACHNGYPQDVEKLEGKFESVPMGITCERCHGPGRLHVDARLSDPDASPAIDTTIVNPVHLGLDRRLDVCQQCHLNGSVDVLRDGRQAFDFLPSQKLSEHRAMFVSAKESGDGIKVISHADRMKQSECFIQTLDAPRPMECTTCHNPHEGFRTRGYEYFTETCMSCHPAGELVAGKSPEFAASHTTESNCISCHMPKEEAIDVPHSSFTDHYIRVLEEGSDSAALGIPEAMTSRDASMTALFERDSGTDEGDIYQGMALITFGRQQADTVAIREGLRLLEGYTEDAILFDDARFLLGLGYLFVGQVSPALDHLESVVTNDPDDPEKLNALAQAYETDGRSRNVIQRLYVRALTIQPHAVDVRLNYGRFLLSVGDVDKAIEEFRQAREERPSDDRAYFNLGTAHLQAGDIADASRFLHASLRMNPDNQEALGNLGFLHAGEGSLDSARVYFERAVSVNDQDPVALGNLGAFYLNEGEREEAISVLERAVSLRDDFADALANLSLAYFQDGDEERSRFYAEKALEANPSHPLARQIVEAL